ncbi:hypothetical protein [Candidatus Palauibacter sp.]|uniref:hypothetical protein n=1 Tax=Candidatus Palauibacter sp. TaxID=3101350 RepID=UPI003B5C5AF0
MKKKRIWLIILALLVLDGLTGFPGFPALLTETRTHYPRDYSEGHARVTTTVCRGVPFAWKSCDVRIRMFSEESESEALK